MSVLNYLFLVVISSLVLNRNEAAKILAVYPVASFSHQVVFRPFTEALLKRGHELTVITTDPAYPKGGTPANLTEIDVHDLSYSIWKDTFMGIPKGHKSHQPANFAGYIEAMRLMIDAQFKDENVQNLINDKTKTFDLILVEAPVRPALIFAHIYNAPAILVSSYGRVFDNYEVIGAPIHPFLYPMVVRQKLNNLTLWDKIKELYLHIRLEIIQRARDAQDNDILKSNFGPDAPSIEELNDRVDMLFLNIHPIFEGIRPVPPSVIYMGGLQTLAKTEKELPKDLKSYLDSSKNGVIYLSFGTNVDPSLLPPHVIQTLIKAFSKLPYDVLWKWNKDELPGRTDNIRISKWLPQSDLLKHPKIKVFITQGGLQSTDEAITAGVPLIGVPMLGDQWFNVERYEYHKIGIGLDMETLTEEKLTNTINKIIGDNSYRQNIVKLRNVMHDQPQSPMDRAVWWTEHVLRHGGARHLRSPAANMSWAQYLELELVLTLLLGLVVLTTVFIMILRLLYKTISTNFTVKVKHS